ncbi:MAG: type II secretion system F family protein [Candidatus Kerfeldbacteria bacterium]|nr:type II secretion system F family protein [Candidatus Kerfeldbacteria bacterium]
MAVFDYKAKDLDGKPVSGAVEAPSESVAQDVLKEKDLVVLSISERKRMTLFQSSFGFMKRVPRKDVVLFARQLAVMISATVPIVQALRILVRQTDNINFKIIISEIADEVDGGAKLSQTLARYPAVFSGFFINMIRSGETTGKLDETLNYLADQQEKDYDLISKIRGAMIYPVFVMGGMLVVGVVMMIFVIPKLTEVIQESGAELPFSTKMLIGASSFMQHYWWTLIIVIVGGAFAVRVYAKSAVGVIQIDKLKMRMPIFGQIFQKIYLVRFSRSLSTLVVSGIPVTKGLEIVADVVGNTTYHDLTLETIREIEAGNSIATAFVRSKEIPPMLPQMMVVGEQTGKLDLILDKLSNFYAKELENLIANLTSLIEPLILVVMGVGVAVMVMSILLPMYNLSSSIT